MQECIKPTKPARKHATSIDGKIPAEERQNSNIGIWMLILVTIKCGLYTHMVHKSMSGSFAGRLQRALDGDRANAGSEHNDTGVKVSCKPL